MARIQAQIRRLLTGEHAFDDIKIKSPEEKARDDAEALNLQPGYEHEADGYVCGKCHNRGHVYFADGSSVVRRECECMAARRSIRRMQRSGLGNVIQKYSFAHFEASDGWQKVMKDTAQRFTADPAARWFFVGGASGSGKSHICTAICRKLLATKAVHYMLWEEESMELKAMVTDGESYFPRLNRLKNVDVLYVDDFFSGHKERNGEVAKPTHADVRLAREILNHRYINDKITIISSEWYADEIYDIDAALGGRLVEKAGQYRLDITRGKDKNYRLKMGGVVL